jgi:hypothetical protein
MCHQITNGVFIDIAERHGLENIEKWVEDVGKLLKLTLIPSPGLKEKFYRRFHYCAGKLRKAGGRRREQTRNTNT